MLRCHLSVASTAGTRYTQNYSHSHHRRARKEAHARATILGGLDLARPELVCDVVRITARVELCLEQEKQRQLAD